MNLFRKRKKTQQMVILSSDIDAYFVDAGRLIIKENDVSVKLLQRTFKIGRNRAEKIIDQLIESGVINDFLSKKILMTLPQFEYLIKNELILSPQPEIALDSCDRGHSAEVKNCYIDYDSMSGKEFELFCADLLRKNTFENVSVTQLSGDFGTDILAYQNGVKYAIQCKCYSCDVGVDAIYQISGGMRYYNANIGIVLTNRYFTKQASELASKIGVVLWDRDYLEKFIEQAN